MSEAAYAVEKGPGMVDRLMGEAQRLHEEIEMLLQKLQPVRSQGPDITAPPMAPSEVPANRLHEAVMTVESANQRLRLLGSELNL